MNVDLSTGRVRGCMVADSSGRSVCDYLIRFFSSAQEISVGKLADTKYESHFYTS